MRSHKSWRPVIIRPIPPFRLDFTVWALRRRPRNAIDRWDGTTYRRIVMIGRRVTELAIRQSGLDGDVARVAPANYHAIGFSRQKVRAQLTLARGIDRGELDVERLTRDGDLGGSRAPS